MHNTLESYKVFPIIAWITVIGFAFFTYTLTTRLNDELSQISSGVDRLEQRLNAIDTTKATKTTETATHTAP